MSAPPPAPVLIVGVLVMLACGTAIAALLLESPPVRPHRIRRPLRLLERERDLAAALGWQWRPWLAVRTVVALLALGLGVVSGVWVLAVVLTLLGVFGVRFAVAGRAARRRLSADRTFLTLLRELRDRMAVSNQSLDTALLDIAAAPPAALAYALLPLSAGGDIADGIVACGERSRSPLIEQGCGVLLWARTRSLDALIRAIDDVLLPVAGAQLAVEEESLVTLAQQRAVTMAMGALLLLMFAGIMRVDTFRAYYATLTGGIILLLVTALFGLLIAAVGRIAAVGGWTRWNLRHLLKTEIPDRV